MIEIGDYLLDKDHNMYMVVNSFNKCGDSYNLALSAVSSNSSVSGSLIQRVVKESDYTVIKAENLCSSASIYPDCSVKVTVNTDDMVGSSKVISDTVDRSYLSQAVSNISLGTKQPVNTATATVDICAGYRYNYDPCNCATACCYSNKKGEQKMIPAIKKYEETERIVYINKVKTVKKVVTVYFYDNTSTEAICSANDTYDLVTGIEQCILKKLCGNEVKNHVEKVIKTQEKALKAIAEKEAAAKKEKELEAARRKKSAEKKLRKQAKWDAMYQVMLEEEKKKLKKIINE